MKEIQFLIYNDEHTEVLMQDESIWATQKSMGELFNVSKSTISEHLKNIFESGELAQDSVVRKIRTTAADGKAYQTAFYNLDAIISVGYRVNSHKATQFRIWATGVLREYIQKGFAMDDNRLKELGGGGYFKELLARIRDIRSSEKVFYRQLLDLFATSQDYNGNSKEARQFFATVQNKMHYAIHQHTAAELVYNRVNSEQDFMGLTTFKGELPTLQEAKTAKNYLFENELKGLNQLVSGYLDFAERQADREITMKMQDWINHVDNILTATGERLLKDNGSISHEQMEKKVESEYQKFHAKTLTQVERDYLSSLKSLEQLTARTNTKEQK